MFALHFCLDFYDVGVVSYVIFFLHDENLVHALEYFSLRVMESEIITRSRKYIGKENKKNNHYNRYSLSWMCTIGSHLRLRRCSKSRLNSTRGCYFCCIRCVRKSCTRNGIYHHHYPSESNVSHKTCFVHVVFLSIYHMTRVWWIGDSSNHDLW